MVLFDVDINGTALGSIVDIPDWAVSAGRRRVVAYGLTGSAAANDAKISIKYNNLEVAKHQNNSAGHDVPLKEDLRYVGSNFVLGRYQPLNIEVTDASGSACYCTILMKFVNSRNTRRFRRF